MTTRTLLSAAALFGLTHPGHGAELLQAGKPLALEGTHGRFDFLAIDPHGRRLLAAHTGNSSLDVIDLDAAAVVKIIPTGAAQSVALDGRGAQYFVSVSAPPQLAVIDAQKLEVVAKIALTGPADLLAFNDKTARAYVGHDDGKELWVVDPAAKKIAATIELPSDAPEDLAFDAEGRRLFQNLKTAGTVAVIDLATNQVVANWPTAPAKAPHGMAVVADGKTLLCAGANGKLVMMKQADGKVVSTAEIGEGVDQIAFDPGLHRVYGASASGKLIVVGVEAEKLTVLGQVATSAGARSVAVDLKTHTVWIAYAKGEASFVQPFTPAK